MLTLGTAIFRIEWRGERSEQQIYSEEPAQEPEGRPDYLLFWEREIVVN